MKKVKNFYKIRSKVLFVSSLISILLFLLLIPEFLNYSNFVHQLTTPNLSEIEITKTSIENLIWAKHATEAIEEFNLIFSCIFVFISLFNLVGYIYKKSEFIFISIGLGVVATCMSIYVSKPIFIFLITLATILNILGYVEQNKIDSE